IRNLAALTEEELMNCNIYIFDDVMYSGNQMRGIIQKIIKIIENKHLRSPSTIRVHIVPIYNTTISRHHIESAFENKDNIHFQFHDHSNIAEWQAFVKRKEDILAIRRFLVERDENINDPNDIPSW